MDEPAIPGQGRISARLLLARGARALAEEGALVTSGLLPSYRTVAPRTHAGAALDHVDAAFVARARALGGDALLAARRVIVTPAPWRAPVGVRVVEDCVELAIPPAEDTAGDALLLVLGLALEAAKLAHGLPAPAGALRAAFATPQAAHDALSALAAGGDVRTVELASVGARVEHSTLAGLLGDRPCFVIAGAGAARAHDVLSPYARRLRGALAELGARAHPGVPRDEAVYPGIEALVASDPTLLGERLAAEIADACTPLGAGALAVRCEALSIGEADGRAREALGLLQRARALLVLVEPRRATLAAVLACSGPATRAVALLGTGTSACAPCALLDEASGHVALLDNALPDAAGVLATAPSQALAGEGPGDAACFGLAQAVFAARAADELDARVQTMVRIVPAGDHAALTRAVLELFARLAPRPPGRRQR